MISDRVVTAHRARGVVEAPTWFGPSERPLFGWFVYPDDERVRGAVVICPPLAEDENKAHRTLRESALRLAEAGFLAFRFDYDGTGDSAGDFNDPHRRDAWTDSVREAIAVVRGSGATSVSLLGMRMGATIATAVASEQELDLDHLLLWDPCVSGTAYLREQQLLQASWLTAPSDLPQGWVETPSYLFSADSARDVRSFVVSADARSASVHETTVLVRDDRPTSRKLTDAFPPESVTWAHVNEQAALLDVSTADARVPENDLDRVLAVLRTPDAPRTDQLSIDQRLRASWTEHGHPLVETVRLVGRDRRLFAIVTEPDGERTAERTALFVNVSFERHIGLGRMWTDVSRRLAARNITSIRLDHSGVGDSGLHPGQQPDLFYDVAWIRDIPDAVSSIAPTRNLVGVGVCSSAVSALQAAWNGAFDEVVAVSVGLASTELRVSRRWTVLTHRPRWLRRIAEHSNRSAVILENIGYVLRPSRHPAHAFRRLTARGARITVLNGPDDDWRLWRNVVWNRMWRRALDDSPNFCTEVFDDVDHSLRSSSARTAIGRRIMQLLTSPADPENTSSPHVPTTITDVPRH